VIIRIRIVLTSVEEAQEHKQDADRMIWKSGMNSYAQ
jgi:hypothetical protein